MSKIIILTRSSSPRRHSTGSIYGHQIGDNPGYDENQDELLHPFSSKSNLPEDEEQPQLVRRPNEIEILPRWAPPFSDQYARRSFVTKVYALIGAQLITIIGFISVFIFCKPLRKWTQDNRVFFYAALVFTAILTVILFCIQIIRRRYPYNIIALIVVTCATGALLGSSASTFSPVGISLAVAIFAVMASVSVIVNYCQKEYDCTKAFSAMTVVFHFILIVVILFIVFLVIKTDPDFPIPTIIYSCIGALVFSAYFIFDLSRMMRRKHTHNILPEESIFAVLSLYSDIIHVIIYYLSVLGHLLWAIQARCRKDCLI